MLEVFKLTFTSARLFWVPNVSRLCTNSVTLNLKKNFEPTPFWESQSMLPSNSSQICLQILRPSPIPLLLTPFFCLSFPKSLNSFGLSSAEIPSPSSYTYTWMNLSPFSWIISPPSSIFPPFRVNFRALDNKFSVTYCILWESIAISISWDVLGW